MMGHDVHDDGVRVAVAGGVAALVLLMLVGLLIGKIGVPLEPLLLWAV